MLRSRPAARRSAGTEQLPRPARWTKTTADTAPIWGQVCTMSAALAWAPANVSPSRPTSEKTEGWSDTGQSPTALPAAISRMPSACRGAKSASRQLRAGWTAETRGAPRYMRSSASGVGCRGADSVPGRCGAGCTTTRGREPAAGRAWAAAPLVPPMTRCGCGRCWAGGCSWLRLRVAAAYETWSPEEGGGGLR